jgi:hypothetical protein
MPFSLNKDAETASMMTLNSTTSPLPASRPTSPLATRETHPILQPGQSEKPEMNTEVASTSAAERPDLETFVTAADGLPMAAKPAIDQERPELETFATAFDELPRAAKATDATTEAKDA